MPALYTAREDWPGQQPEDDSVWVIYSTHEEVSAILTFELLSLAGLCSQRRLELDVDRQRLKPPTRRMG
jgi:hypothetical protein